ncbi:MAG: methylenetetrahydrofolate reductase [Nocardioides sp.]
MVAPGPEPSIGRLLREGERSISFEFMPPRDEAGAEQLWHTIAALEPLAPTFVSVTYGAGGSTRDTTVALTGRIARETSLRAMGHLTCVGHTRADLVRVLTSYADAGVHNILALRGDPKDGPSAPWVATEGGLTYARELVELAHQTDDFTVGVAAFPEGHPAADSLERDAWVLAEKARAGADFAVTQLFFRPDDYVAGRARRRRTGGPIVPGIMPITSLRSLQQMAERCPARRSRYQVLARVEHLGTRPARAPAPASKIATELSGALLAAGAPGLHFYT